LSEAQICDSSETRVSHCKPWSSGILRAYGLQTSGGGSVGKVRLRTTATEFSLGSLNNAVCNLDCTASNSRNIRQFGKIWKEIVVAYFKGTTPEFA
jgi:hypothetical protein